VFWAKEHFTMFFSLTDLQKLLFENSVSEGSKSFFKNKYRLQE